MGNPNTGNYQRKNLRLFFAKEPRRLVISLILFSISLTFSIAYFSNIGAAVMAVYSMVIIAYMMVYGLQKNAQNNESRSLSYLFLLSAVLFIIATCLLIVNGAAGLSQLSYAQYTFIHFLLFIPIFFMLQLYLYIKNKKVKIALMALIVLIIAIYFTYLIFVADDETVIAFYAIKSFLGGINPYSVSIANILYNYHQSTNVGLTINSNSGIMDMLGYPALYFLVQLPFFLIFNPSMQALTGSFMKSQGAIFFLVFIFSYLLIARNKKEMKSNFPAYFLLGMLILSLSSLVIFLMMAVILLMYSRFGDKYSWLILGIALSLQEQLWVIVILFIVYSFNSYGFKKGIADAIGSLSVFLLINGYFISADPAIYVHNLLTVASNILPNSLAPIGYFLVSVYPVPFHTFVYLFLLSLALTIAILLYTNKKKLVPLLSIIPFLFLNHGLAIYYLLPFAAFAFISESGIKDDSKNSMRSALNKNKDYAFAFFGIIAAAVVLIIAVIYAGHLAYTNNLGISIQNQSITQTSPGNYIYSSRLSSVPDSNAVMSLLIEVISNGSDMYYGLFNSSIIKGSLNCSFPCSVNVNKIALPPSGSYNLSASISGNIIKQAYFSAVLYNKDYYYRSQPIKYR